MVRTVLAWIRFAFSVAWALLGWAWVALAVGLFFADYKTLRYEHDGMLVTAEWRSWFAKFYRYSTTVGRGVIYYPGVRDASDGLDERVERHERVHIWQKEDISFRFLLVGILVTAWTGDWGLGIFLWLSAPLWMITNFGTALLRFSHNAEWPKTDENGLKKFFKFMHHLFVDIAYRDSEHERSAYAQTALLGDQSWWQFREKQRAQMTGESLEDHERPV